MTAPAQALLQVFAEALRAVDPAAATARTLEGADARNKWRDRRVWIAAIGKAATAMTAGASSVLGDRVGGGIVVAPALVPAPLGGRVVAIPGEHPVPGTSSLVAGRALIALAAAIPADHLMIALVSGGASSMAAVPGTGVTLAEKVDLVRAAVAAGEPIREVNRLRTSLSAIKGGRLASRCLAPVLSVVISDVVGDDPSIVGSGPTVGAAARGREQDSVLVASGIADLANAARLAGERILRKETNVVDSAMLGDVEVVAARVATEILDALAARRSCGLVWTGEPTIRLGPMVGQGGRARHLALLVARTLQGHEGWSLLCAGSDGVDGTSDAAGAIVDGESWHRIRAAGHEPDRALLARDAGSVLASISADIVTGPTGVNHADLLVADVVSSVL